MKLREGSRRTAADCHWNPRGDRHMLHTAVTSSGVSCVCGVGIVVGVVFVGWWGGNVCRVQGGWGLRGGTHPTLRRSVSERRRGTRGPVVSNKGRDAPPGAPQPHRARQSSAGSNGALEVCGRSCVPGGRRLRGSSLSSGKRSSSTSSGGRGRSWGLLPLRCQTVGFGIGGEGVSSIREGMGAALNRATPPDGRRQAPLSSVDSYCVSPPKGG